MHPWFIFTSTGGLFTTQAESITKAVSAFKRCKHPRSGEIVGVIRGGAEMQYLGAAKATPVFGVICCAVESSNKHQ